MLLLTHGYHDNHGTHGNMLLNNINQKDNWCMGFFSEKRDIIVFIFYFLSEEPTGTSKQPI